MNGPGNGNYVDDEMRMKQAAADRARTIQLSRSYGFMRGLRRVREAKTLTELEAAYKWGRDVLIETWATQSEMDELWREYHGRIGDVK